MRALTIYTKIVLFAGLAMMAMLTTTLAGTATDHDAHVGELIHESTAKGHKLTYHLLDLPNRRESHLMVYIVSPDGQAVTNAKVGYLVKGPDTASQKAMAMRMDNAFGADVNFSKAGSYTIKVKAVVGDNKIFDNFLYQSQ